MIFNGGKNRKEAWYMRLGSTSGEGRKRGKRGERRKRREGKGKRKSGGRGERKEREGKGGGRGEGGERGRRGEEEGVAKGEEEKNRGCPYLYVLCNQIPSFRECINVSNLYRSWNFNEWTLCSRTNDANRWRRTT